MGLEADSAVNIKDFDPNWPLGGDPTIDGDNHIRLIKRVLKNAFQGPDGLGFDEPVTASPEELNYLEGCTGNVQDQIDTLSSGGTNLAYRLLAPIGTVLFVFQPPSKAIPVGWRVYDDSNSYLLVSVSRQEAGSTYGKDSPKSWTHSHANSTIKITAANLPPHAHNLYYRVGATTGLSGNEIAPWYEQNDLHTTEPTGTGWGSNTSIQLPNTLTSTWEPRYAGVLAIERI